MIDKVKYWIELSDYDLETADAMLKTKRYLYVGFMCHQAIEKALKAYYTKQNTDKVPFTHSLSRLIDDSGLKHILSENQLDFIDQIEPLNIETRYPSHKDRLLKSLTPDRCLNILNKTKTFQKWIKEIL